MVNAGIGCGMARPVEVPRQQALTATPPHTAGDGMLPFFLVFFKSFHRKASRLFLDFVTGALRQDAGNVLQTQPNCT
jgi:hypothetical protein